MALRCNKITLQSSVDLIKTHIQGEVLILQHTFVFSLHALLRAVRVFGSGVAAHMVSKKPILRSDCSVHPSAQTKEQMGTTMTESRALFVVQLLTTASGRLLAFSSTWAAQAGGYPLQQGGKGTEGVAAQEGPPAVMSCVTASL